MKPSFRKNHIALLLWLLSLPFFFTDCKKTENPIRFDKGTFPDTVVNMGSINSQYDDYNISLPQFNGESPIIFSSNRKSSGGQFDLEQAMITFVFDRTNGNFTLNAEMSSDEFLDKLINKAVTPGNDFGPYRLFSTVDGFEYMILSSVNAQGNLDLYYLKNQPVYNTNLPAVDGPHTVSILNSDSDDAYICFNSSQDSAYFASDRDGDFDIFQQEIPAEMALSEWFSQGFSSSAKVDSLNSTGNDKCPMIFKKVMVFASDRAGGLGGYDLYYSLFLNGKWNSPVNMGPGINTSSDEYRPVLGYHPDFTNLFMMFSSNRPGGKGNFDLYFTGIEFPGNQL
jgi:hypothetical protein